MYIYWFWIDVNFSFDNVSDQSSFTASFAASNIAKAASITAL